MLEQKKEAMVDEKDNTGLLNAIERGFFQQNVQSMCALAD
jgi:hypothetical protein